MARENVISIFLKTQKENKNHTFRTTAIIDMDMAKENYYFTKELYL